LERGLNKSGLIDDHLQQLAKADKKRKEVLERITATIQNLAQQNLSLQRHRESLVGDSNTGNFLALLKYFPKFYPFMREHLDSFSEVLDW
jgi:hypothetical protein